jgi:hypothetical protein
MGKANKDERVYLIIAGLRNFVCRVQILSNCSKIMSGLILVQVLFLSLIFPDEIVCTVDDQIGFELLT